MSLSVTLVRNLVDVVTRTGGDGDEYLARAGVPRVLLDDPDARVDDACYNRLEELALDATGDPALGLHMGAHTPLSAFHVVGFLSANCRTLRDGFHVFQRYQKLIVDSRPPLLLEEGELAIIEFYVVPGSARVSRLRAEFEAVSLLRVAQTFLGMPSPPRAVEFSHAAPDYAGEYERVLGCSVHFGCAADRIIFPRELLDLPQRHANAELFQLLESEAARKLAGLDAHARWAERVRALLMQHYDGDGRTMQTVATRLGLSARSLRRHLQEEGRTFTELVDEALAEVARRLLRNPAATIDEVADRLGFSERSAFHRAFKRWTGVTPRQFRGTVEPHPLKRGS
jgi:AraC-like DNA-binding protein